MRAVNVTDPIASRVSTDLGVTEKAFSCGGVMSFAVVIETSSERPVCSCSSARRSFGVACPVAQVDPFHGPHPMRGPARNVDGPGPPAVGSFNEFVAFCARFIAARRPEPHPNFAHSASRPWSAGVLCTHPETNLRFRIHDVDLGGAVPEVDQAGVAVVGAVAVVHTDLRSRSRERGHFGSADIQGCCRGRSTAQNHAGSGAHRNGAEPQKWPRMARTVAHEGSSDNPEKVRVLTRRSEAAR